MSPGWSSLLWFAAIVVAIPFVLVLLKRTPLGGGAAAGRGMRLVGALPLAQHQRIVTVEVGEGADRRWLVLGVTAQQISTLHTMAPQAEPATALPPPFAQALGRLWSKPAGGPDAR
jgi:flagellar protein FliO/FliZ